LSDVFIVGSPRSGTTWLHTLLADHPDVASPPELHLFPEFFGPAEARWNERARRNAELRAAGIGGVGLEDLLDRAELLAWMRALYCTARDAVLARKPGATRLFEKTPENALYLPLIREVVPGAKFVHLARDPRNAVASMLERSRRPFGDWAPSDLPAAVAAWRASVTAALRDADPHDTLLVRYEDLKADPRATLADLAVFLDLRGPVESWLGSDPTARALDRAGSAIVRDRAAVDGDGDSDGDGAPGWGSDAFGAPTTTALSQFERWYVESRCSTEMSALDYRLSEFEPGRPSPARRTEVILRLDAPRVARRIARRAGRSLRARGKHSP
jgi:hypothetical protein